MDGKVPKHVTEEPSDEQQEIDDDEEENIKNKHEEAEAHEEVELHEVKQAPSDAAVEKGGSDFDEGEKSKVGDETDGDKKIVGDEDDQMTTDESALIEKNEETGEIDDKEGQDRSMTETAVEGGEHTSDTTLSETQQVSAEEEKKEPKIEEAKIPDDFYYDYEKFVSVPVIIANSGLPKDMLTLKHSYGYDCTKRANLHLLNVKTVVFAAGNMVQIVDLQTKAQTFIRSTSGGGIGAIGVHPSRQFFAVAEKGDSPNINVYEWPSLKLFRILRGGTQRSYTFVTFNPDGTMLASQGGDPDFMLTLWDWKQEKIVLRSKAFSQDVFRVSFSNELASQLTTSGTVHISVHDSSSLQWTCDKQATKII